MPITRIIVAGLVAGVCTWVLPLPSVECPQNEAKPTCQHDACSPGCISIDGLVHACFAPGTSREHMAQIEMQMRSLLPDGLRYSTDRRWTETATDGSVGGDDPVIVTYSFVPDSVQNDNDLHLAMDSMFGSRLVWQNRIRAAFNRWSELCGVSFVETDDDGAPWPNSPGAEGVRGDIRIVGRPIDGANGVLAYAFMPNTGDMAIDTDEDWADEGNDYRFLRNVVAHELGHSLGLLHVLPQDNTKLMEAYLSLNFDGPQDDDIRGVNYFYGDPLERNDGAGTARLMGVFSDGMTFEDLALRTAADEDWYLFLGGSGTALVFRAIPVGAAYNVSPDPGFPEPINTMMINPLSVEIYADDGETLLASGSVQVAGGTAVAGPATLPLGESDFYVRVFSEGTRPDVQRYTLTAEAAPPTLRTLTLTSSPEPNVPYTVVPAPVGGTTGGNTPAMLEFYDTQEITVTAPPNSDGANFLRWELDGVEQPEGNRTLTLQMNDDHAATMVFSPLLTVDAGPDLRAVKGESVELSVTVADGTPPYTYAWTPALTLENPNTANPTASPTRTTQYTVTVIDAEEGRGSDTVTVELVNALEADAGPSQMVLAGESFSLTGGASGGVDPYTYAWAPASIFDDPTSQTPQGVVDGTTQITLTVTDADGREATDFLSVRVPEPLRVTLDDARTVRAGDPLSLTATASGGVMPYRYEWTPGDSEGRSLEVTPAETTTYAVVVTDSMGQEARGDVTITVAPKLTVTVSATADEIELGASTELRAQVSGGEPPFTYTWTPVNLLDAPAAAITSTAPSVTTVFTLEVADALGQTARDSIDITVFEPETPRTEPTGFVAPCGFGMLTPLALLLGLWPVRLAYRRR